MHDELALAARQRAAAEIALPINLTHKEIDDALAAGAETLAKLMRNRRPARLNGVSGQPLVAHAIDGLRQLGEARQAWIVLHEKLGSFAEHLGVTVAEGDEGPKDKYIAPAMSGEAERMHATG